MANDFGFCLRGSLDYECGLKVGSHVQLNRIACTRTEELLLTPRPNPSKLLEDYFLMKSLGTQCIPRCGGCKFGHFSLT